MRIIDRAGFSQANTDEIATQESTLTTLETNKINYTDIESSPTDNASKIVGSKWNYDNLLFTGAILPYGGITAPSGFLKCEGETIGNDSSGANYQGDNLEELFNLLKPSWGNAGTESFAGDDTVKLPNLQAMFLRGKGTQDINARTKTGPNVGVSQEDYIQGHKFNWKFANAISDGGAGSPSRWIANQTSSAQGMWRDNFAVAQNTVSMTEALDNGNGLQDLLVLKHFHQIMGFFTL